MEILMEIILKDSIKIITTESLLYKVMEFK